MLHSKLEEFLPAIKSLQPHKSLTKEDVLTDDFLMENTGDIAMYYAPHNEYINRDAKIVIVGITPGWNQMKTAFEQALTSLAKQHPADRILKEAKIAASFAGTMRRNLIHMLDECAIPEVIDAGSSAVLFKEKRNLLHTTSIIKYPVFHHGRNYTGHQPSIDHHSLLSSYAYHVFPKELSQIREPALVIPLGKTVDHIFQKLREKERLPAHTYLFGFPHPSGANGHRKKQFDQRKGELISAVKTWSENR
ncbi:uracil-DNA glycosylase family protein [Lentibacillus sediminis]|uniref:uracil-DNA glycosylase family protein n=1 Tax=Lentibacillus sediminis TaxID=1940529 RepID=UPI000C1BDF8A|nr:uracil-DNA glycosylase family protein [Lentibacillus sediminis]